MSDACPWKNGDYVRLGHRVGVVANGEVHFPRGAERPVLAGNLGLRPATVLEFVAAMPTDADTIERYIATGESIPPGTYEVGRTIVVRAQNTGVAQLESPYENLQGHATDSEAAIRMRRECEREGWTLVLETAGSWPMSDGRMLMFSRERTESPGQKGGV